MVTRATIIFCGAWYAHGTGIEYPVSNNKCQFQVHCQEFYAGASPQSPRGSYATVYIYIYIYICEVNRTCSGSGLEWTFFSGCMSSVRYFVSQLEAKQRARANCGAYGMTDQVTVWVQDLLPGLNNGCMVSCDSNNGGRHYLLVIILWTMQDYGWSFLMQLVLEVSGQLAMMFACALF